MISVEEQTRIARDFLVNIGRGGIDHKYIADDFTAWSLWSSAAGMISREKYLPNLTMMPQLFDGPLEMKIDTTTAQPGRVALQTRSHGVLITGEEYRNEYLFLIEFNDKGQIRHVREYFNVDPFRQKLFPAIQKWRAAHSAG